MKRDAIDYHQVPDHQQAMHERLMNWGRWCNPRGANGRAYPSVASGFGLYRPERGAEYNQYDEARKDVDTIDAGKVQAAIVLMCLQSDYCTMMAKALHWWYVRPVSDYKGAEYVGLVERGQKRPAGWRDRLAVLVIEARSHLAGRIA